MSAIWKAPALALMAGLAGGIGSLSHAAGTLVEGDGSLVGGPVVDADIAHVRAVLVQQDTTVTAIVQAATHEGQTIGSAWILPVPGTIVAPPVTGTPVLIGELLRVTDPIFQAPPLPSSSGCDFSVGCGGWDSGDSGARAFANVGLFNTNRAGATWSYFGPDSVEEATDSLRQSGFDVSASVEDGLRDHAIAGGSVVVMFFTEASSGSATPALVVRYEASELVVPQALTAESSADLVQTTVLTLTEDGATRPVGVPHTQPRLGKPLYPHARATAYYAGRTLAALDAAGPGAWMLEYSGSLDQLEDRRMEMDNYGSYRFSEPPWEGLSLLVDAGQLDYFSPSELWATRWLTYQERGLLRDQAFIPDSTIPRYEVLIESSQFQSGLFWPMPLLLGAWVMSRRLRRRSA